jgi:DNA-binding MarR family transcriptional regulator
MTEKAERLLIEAENSDSAVSPVLAPLGLAFKRMTVLVERETGVSARTWFVLSMLSKEDGISQGDMCQQFGRDPSRLTRIGQALEREGMIRRERDPEDNRVVRMYLTEEGRATLRHLPGLGEELERRIHGVMSDEELKELRRLLILLAGAMRD